MSASTQTRNCEKVMIQGEMQLGFIALTGRRYYSHDDKLIYAGLTLLIAHVHIKKKSY